MKAYVLRSVGSLDYCDVEDPVLQPGWVIVKVKSAGICSSDIPRIFVKGTYHFPTIPGHEFSGIVYKTLECDSRWINKRVGIFPLIPCKSCEECLKGHYVRCSSYDYIGSRRDGAFAEYVLVPVWNLIELPNGVSYDVAALLEPMSVALHASNCIGSDTKRLGVIGTGSIDFLLGYWSKNNHGCTVDIIARNNDKQSIAQSLGLSLVTEPNGLYDTMVEGVGTIDSLVQCLECVKPGGTIILLGNPKGSMELSQDVYWKILRKEITIKGTWNSDYNGTSKSDWTRSVELLNEQSSIIECLITHKYDSSRLMDGLVLMRDKKEPYCKVMIEWA